MSVDFIGFLRNEFVGKCGFPQPVANLTLSYFVDVKSFERNANGRWALDPQRFIQVWLEGDCFRDLICQSDYVKGKNFDLEILIDRAKVREDRERLQRVDSLFRQRSLWLGQTQGYLLRLYQEQRFCKVEVFDERGVRVNPITREPFAEDYCRFAFWFLQSLHFSQDRSRVVGVAGSRLIIASHKGSACTVVNSDFNVEEAHFVDDAVVAFSRNKEGLFCTRYELGQNCEVVKQVTQQLDTYSCDRPHPCFFDEATSLFYYLNKKAETDFCPNHGHNRAQASWDIYSFDCRTLKSQCLELPETLKAAEVYSFCVQGNILAIAGSFNSSPAIELIHLTNRDMRFPRITINMKLVRQNLWDANIEDEYREDEGESAVSFKVKLVDDTLYAYYENTTLFKWRPNTKRNNSP